MTVAIPPAYTTGTFTTKGEASAGPESASDGAFGGHGLGWSVGLKVRLVFVVILTYFLGVAIFAMYQKSGLFQRFEEIQATIEDSTMLAQAHASIFHAIGAITVNANDADAQSAMRRIQLHEELFYVRQNEVATRFPLLVSNAGDVNAAFRTANKNPSADNLKQLAAELLESEAELESASQQVLENRKLLSEQYRMQSDFATLMVLLLGVLGLLMLGGIVVVFFRRLVEDLRVLQNAALATVRGIRGAPMEVTRRDEVGQLMMAVNSMADTLDKSSNELMLERQKYFHQEKMAAIGTLAAGISHEIGNPIAAISGIAQNMIDRRASGRRAWGVHGCEGCHPDMIYAQTERLAAITREISEFASPRATDPQLLDLNAQLRSTASLIRYDKRLNGVDLELVLDTQLPAIVGVADQLTQLVINLVINAIDALEGLRDRKPRIVIKTGSKDHLVWVVVEDNGCGMPESTVNHVFEAFFTTKLAGKGTGLGLSLCHSIVAAHGGYIEIQSTPEVGTQVQIFFPA